MHDIGRRATAAQGIEESTVRDEARNAGEKAAAAVAESLAQLEPRPRKARATAVEDVAGTLDAIVEGGQAGERGGRVRPGVAPAHVEEGLRSRKGLRVEEESRGG